MFNDKKLKIIRRKLRRNQTDAEKLLWTKVRSKQIFNHKFYRQFSVGNFVFDFCCPKRKLAIEIDGGQHYDSGKNQHKDILKTEFIEKNGYKLVRFSNIDVLKNIEGVIEKIIEYLEK